MNAHARRLVLAVGISSPCFLPIATARSQDSSSGRAPSPSTPRAAHERLTAFEGTWSRIGTPHGRTVVDTCAWLAEGRRHMVCRQRAERPGGVSEQMAVYSYRGGDSTYTLAVFLSGGQVWRYAGRPEGSRWTFYLQSNRPDVPSRLRQIVVALGDTLRFIEEVSEDGNAWRLSDPSEDYRSVRVSPRPAAGLAQASADDGRATVIYFVRHAEVEPVYPTPLSAAGKVRARVFARSVGGVRFTHVFSTHTLRAYEMVEPVAQEQGLPVRQLPQPGMRLGGVVVADSTPARMAVAPLVAALRALPLGSTALVGVNSDNIYALLNGLGVPVAPAGGACTKGSPCVPCLTNACFPGGYDQLWMLVVVPGSKTPKLMELRYGSDDR